MDERSFTALPEVELPKRKLYEDPDVLFCGFSRALGKSLPMSPMGYFS
jgi:hypothetical protein